MQVFNLGLGMLVILAPEQVTAAINALGEDVWQVGEMVARGDGPAVLIA
jgi:phosphoribosylaminoimidazole (AIR) synthetase